MNNVTPSRHYCAALYTASEVRFAFFLGGVAGAFLTVAMAFVWSWWLS